MVRPFPPRSGWTLNRAGAPQDACARGSCFEGSLTGRDRHRSPIRPFGSSSLPSWRQNLYCFLSRWSRPIQGE